ncbi:protein AAR2 homolog [Mercenaria mercenaria]|uniref:protein AAR2 homolog n=1 Tax=Mercenaria mercenaria TaxID=6596 RepID=UPI00234E7EB2|nr:protein AAR2 homolog [Mercenaria mercenaria]XP_045207761.2 protein AAR2 homolog [Mercenaria mercenaria]XP_053408325.1 protein AAR2 homolog [Mercenaria mercenaria]
MDNDTAKVLFHEGATFVLLDMPEGSEFGIDYNSWTTGPKFKGVKMIPPGIHFVYYSAKSCSLGGMRTGFFYNFKQKEVLVKRWDKYNEDISEGPVSPEDRERVASNMKELDQYLGPYPYDSYKKWVSLTNHITDDLLSRLQPECGTITSVTQFESPFSNSQMRREAAEKKLSEEGHSEEEKTNAQKGLPKLTKVAGTEMRFTKIPKQRYPKDATPQDITRHSMDSSYMLETLLKSVYSKNNNEILGEIQFAFVCFLIGQVYDAFDQWKRLVHLLCSSEAALNSHSELFMNLISMLHFQVHEIPEDFFVDIVSANNFLTSTLQEFFSNLDEGNGDSKLRQRGRKFREHLTKKFKWDFMTEPDDFAPVIVDT